MQTDTHVYIPLVYAYTGYVHKHKWLPLAVEASEFEIESQRRKNRLWSSFQKCWKPQVILYLAYPLCSLPERASIKESGEKRKGKILVWNLYFLILISEIMKFIHSFMLYNCCFFKGLPLLWLFCFVLFIYKINPLFLFPHLKWAQGFSCLFKALHLWWHYTRGNLHSFLYQWDKNA